MSREPLTTQESFDLAKVQRWMQAVITHPAGVVEGIEADTAQIEIELNPGQVENVILPSKNLGSIERLGVYANAYYARLTECLREEFPVTTHILGEETFDAFAFSYLQSYPSQSYTLADLGAHFPRFLQETRPDADEFITDQWMDFLIDLATLERVYSEIFIGEGVEGQALLTIDHIQSVLPDQWEDLRFVPVPCLKLLKLTFPVHETITRFRDTGQSEACPAEATFLVVTRRDYVVRRASVEEAEFSLLSDLVEGLTFGQATTTLSTDFGFDDDDLTVRLEQWFRRWASSDYFSQILF